ncbi:MAG: hypothetical protein HQK76_02665 [Desulfobacterales bacterium]|nr:hypothetical protein [Desulfobacterales bacterium]
MKKKIMFFLLVALIFSSQINASTKITPNDVYSAVDIINRSLDIFLKQNRISNFESLDINEIGLRPMHVCQMAVTAVDAMIEFQESKEMRASFKIVVTPKEYIPHDIKLLADYLLSEIIRTADELKIDNLPNDKRIFSNKTPTDVFKGFVDIFLKFKFLTKNEEISPNTGYSEVVRAVLDAKSILTTIDSEQRFRIDAPKSPKGLKPANVYQECIEARKGLNKVRKNFKMEEIPIPMLDDFSKINPADVFIQVQIIIAELNLLKRAIGTISSTPIPIAVNGKTPSDVHEQLVLLKYLLLQIEPLQEMMSKINS